MPGAVREDPESMDLGSGVPSTPVPPQPNLRASSTSLPAIVTATPAEELAALAELCRQDGGIVAVFKRMRSRTHSVERGLHATNQFVAQIRLDLGEVPSPLKPDSGSGALRMLTEQGKQIADLVTAVNGIREDLRKDREAREAAEKAALEALEKSPAARVRWVAIAALVGAVIASGVSCGSAYIARNWNPPATPSTASPGPGR